MDDILASLSEKQLRQKLQECALIINSSHTPEGLETDSAYFECIDAFFTILHVHLELYKRNLLSQENKSTFEAFIHVFAHLEQVKTTWLLQEWNV